MTKQEEIREGIARWVCIWHIGKPKMWDEEWDNPDHFPSWEGPPREDYYEAADMVMKYEDSQGVVLKVNKPIFRRTGMQDLVVPIEIKIMHELREAYKKAGYVAVVPLIKEE